MTKTNDEHARLVERLCQLMEPAGVRAAAPELSVAELQRLIAGCEAQERRYAEAGFEPMG